MDHDDTRACWYSQAMEERGFDALQKGSGPLILIASTVLLLAIIFAGGMMMQRAEMRWRAAHREEKDDKA